VLTVIDLQDRGSPSWEVHRTGCGDIQRTKTKYGLWDDNIQTVSEGVLTVRDLQIELGADGHSSDYGLDVDTFLKSDAGSQFSVRVHNCAKV